MQKSQSIFFGALLFFVLITSIVPVVAQQHFAGHNWYFGNSDQAIRFNRADNSASLINGKAIPFGTGGSAVATDPANGNLLFYTDGNNVYDVTNSVMPNGTGLGANTTSNQPVVIAKAPGQSTQYYVFTNTASFTTGGTVSFRVVDMALFGNAVFPTPAIGDATSGTNTPVTGLTGRSEAMITIPHANREDFWLITHANGTPDYSVTLFDATGPVNTMNFNGLGLIEVAANFSYHPSSGRIAVSPQEDTRDVEIVNFDNTNGVLSFTQRVLNTGIPSTATQAIYDAEWSSNGQYLYISMHGEAGIQADVLQYDFLNQLGTLTSVLPQPNTISRSYGLQMAPDSAIYHLYQAAAGGPFLLGTLTNTDTVASEVVYDPSAFASATDFFATQFSSFAPKDSVLLSVTFTSQGTCSNAPTSFFPEVTPAADSLVWDFGDGSGGAGWSPVYTYQAGGAYNVRVRAFLNGDTASFAQTINITQFDLQLTLVQDTTACVCELPVNNGQPTAAPGVSCPDDTSDDMAVTVQVQGGSPTFQWFGPGGQLTGQTTATLRPDSAGYYYVVATDASGCSAYAGVNIKEYDSLDQRANIWHFGQNAGIDFNGLPDDPAVGIVGPLDTPEGTSVISDRNGQVIFSTDGQSIFIRDPNDPTQFADITPAPNPPGLGGQNTSTQSALIMPVPGDETLFYIFTTQEVHGTYAYELRYSLFDLKLNNGQGGLAEFNVLLFSKSTERITGSGDWLIAHEYGNNSFRAYNISTQGISNPVISSIGSDHSVTAAENGQGYMELGSGNRLAVALSTPGVSNVVEVFDFVDSTGMVTNFRTADLESPTGQVYGIEISPGGNKLFATLKDANSQLYEFAFDSLGNPYFKQSVSQTGELGAMQIGPDGQIYVAINGSTTLGTFTANEDTTQVTALPLPLQPFTLAGGTTSQLGLPNFTQIIANPTQGPGFTFAGLCLGDSTRFSATGKDPAIDKFDWSFGDGSSQSDGGPQIAHLYGAPGTYTVNVTIYNKCETVGVFTQDVVINDVPPDPSTAVVMCTGSVDLDANPNSLPGFTYVWNTGDTTRRLTVNQQAIYNVTITDALGCTTDGQFLASDNRPQLEFGPDLTLCQNTPIAPLDAQNPGATYAWEINGAPTGGTVQTQSVDTSVPGAFEYKVQVTDPITTCFARDSITYTINESPAFTAVPTDPTACGAADGNIDLTITAPTASLFTYFITGTTPLPPGTPTTDQPANVLISTGQILEAGTYGITIQDQVSGCNTITTVNINDPAFTVATAQLGTCDPDIRIDVSTTPGVATPITFRVLDNATGAVIIGPSGTGNAPTGTFTTLEVPSGSAYVVEVTETASGCTASAPALTINQGAAFTVTFDNSNLCTNGELTAVAAPAGATTFDWSQSPAGSVSSTTGATVTVNPGTWILEVTADDGPAGTCPGIGTTTVTVDQPITANFTQSDPCADQVILTATPAGSFTYRWYQDGVLIPGGGGQQIIAGVTDNGSDYLVEVVNTVTGCVYSFGPVQVNVAGDLSVTLTSTTPCEGSPFTLTAATNPPSITSFQWTLNDQAIPGQSSSSLQDQRAGNYEVTISQSGCTVSDNMNIELLPVTRGLLQDRGIICPYDENPDVTTRTINLDPGPGFLTYNWFYEGASAPGTNDEQIYEATTAGTFSVDLVNTFGCASSDEILLIEECEPRIAGPNAFRPTSEVNEGGEFTNREFRLFTFFIADTDFQIFVFNRWGEMVYQSNQREFRWNGGYNNNMGQPLPPGTYSYLVQYKSSFGRNTDIQEKRGGVVLLR